MRSRGLICSGSQSEAGVPYRCLRVAKKEEKGVGREAPCGKVKKTQVSQGVVSAMSIKFRQGKLEEEERKTILQQVQCHMQQVAQEAVREVATEVVEAEVTAKLGREKGQPRQSQERAIDWKCKHCECSDANQFIRDGHYRRELQTGWGVIQDLHVPMLECQHCKHDVVCDYAILEKYKRFWMDLSQDALWSSGCI